MKTYFLGYIIRRLSSQKMTKPSIRLVDRSQTLRDSTCESRHKGFPSTGKMMNLVDQYQTEEDSPR